MKFFLLMTTVLTGLVFADEAGKELHNESCLACHVSEHDADFYNRQERKMTSLGTLKGQVSRCIQVFDVDWFPDEEESVIDYLNNNYYHFK